MLNTGVVPVFKWLPSPEAIPAGAFADIEKMMDKESFQYFTFPHLSLGRFYH